MDERALDRLYAAPLDEFVARRRELARSARKAGDRETADEIEALRKPTVVAWAVNQLALRKKADLRKLLTAGERLRRAQEQVLKGRDPKRLGEAAEAERRLLADLTEAAGSFLQEAGHPATVATLDRVSRTLHAAATRADVGELARRGRLVQEAEASGFGFEGS
jgi:hypothetical protein